MRLLVCTQAVDRTDPILGFFHAWIAALAARFETVEIICLKEGDHALPHNVRVHSLGKERGAVSRLRYAARFLKLVWRLRGSYDAVFVHMNQEYVLLAGWLWRLLRKRMVLWRNHKMGSFFTRIAGELAHTVCFTSPAAYVAQYNNAVQMPIGIDTNLFTPATTLAPKSTVLFLGRLDAVKKPNLFLEAVAKLEQEGTAVHAEVYGDPTPGRKAYAEALKEKYRHLVSVSFFPGVTHDQTPALYQAHSIYVNTTPSGSFDKTIGEAMASGCVVVVANAAVREVVGQGLFIETAEDVQAVAKVLRAALDLSEEERKKEGLRVRTYVEERHSLALLMEKLFGILAS